MKIYTRTGDGGSTSLYGGERRSKADIRIQSYGEVDELQAVIGLARAQLTEDLVDLNDALEPIQETLFVLCAELARTETVVKRGDPVVVTADITQLEEMIDGYEKELPALRAFILQGGSECGATFHLARAVCRRAERAVVSLAAAEEVNELVIKYLNRLSDLLFVMARLVNKRQGKNEVEWHAKKV